MSTHFELHRRTRYTGLAVLVGVILAANVAAPFLRPHPAHGVGSRDDAPTETRSAQDRRPGDRSAHGPDHDPDHGPASAARTPGDDAVSAPPRSRARATQPPPPAPPAGSR